MRLARTAGPFDETTIPAALRKDHRVAERTWGLVRATSGRVGFSMQSTPPITRTLAAGDTQPIPPGMSHALDVNGPVQLEVDFLVLE